MQEIIKIVKSINILPKKLLKDKLVTIYYNMHHWCSGNMFAFQASPWVRFPDDAINTYY